MRKILYIFFLVVNCPFVRTVFSCSIQRGKSAQRVVVRSRGADGVGVETLAQFRVKLDML